MAVPPLTLDPPLRSDFTGYNPFQGSGFGNHPLLQLLLQTLAPQLFASRGMFAAGFTQQNVYDRLSSFRTQQLHDDVLAQASQRDFQNYMNTFRGVGQLFGMTPGPESNATFQQWANAAVAVGPTMAQISPGTLNAFGNMNVVMAEQMFQGARYRMDPATGRVGLGRESMTRLIDDTHQALYGGPEASRRLLTAGRMGEMYNELQRLGLMPGGEVTLRDLTGAADPRYTQAVSQGAAGLGFNVGPNAASPDLARLTTQQLKQLEQSPQVAAAMKSFDSARVIDTLKGYEGAVATVQEIFGAAGRGDAPMGELINALNQLSGGAMTQVPHGQLHQLTRRIQDRIATSDLGLEGVLMLGEVATQQAQMRGLPQVTTMQILDQTLAYREAFIAEGRNLGGGVFGLSNYNEFSVMKLQALGAATQSPLANQIGAAMRMEEAAGGPGRMFREGSTMAAYLEAARQGRTRFRDPATGKERSLYMESEADFIAMAQQGAALPMDRATLFRFLRDESSNMRLITEQKLGLTVQRLQGEEFFTLPGGQGAEAAGFNATGQVERLTNLRGERARRLGGAVGQVISAAMPQLTKEELKTPEAMNAALRRTLLEQLRAGAAGRVAGLDQGDARTLLRRLEGNEGEAGLLVADVLGGIETASQLSGATTHDRLALSDMDLVVDRSNIATDIRGRERDVLGPLGESSMLRNAVEAIQTAGPDTDLVDVMFRAAGGVPKQRIVDALGKDGQGLLAKIREEGLAYQQLATQYEASNPEERGGLQAQLDAAAQAYQSTLTQFAEIAKVAGLPMEAEAVAAGMAPEDVAAMLPGVEAPPAAAAPDWTVKPGKRALRAAQGEVVKPTKGDLRDLRRQQILLAAEAAPAQAAAAEGGGGAVAGGMQEMNLRIEVAEFRLTQDGAVIAGRGRPFEAGAQ